MGEILKHGLIKDASYYDWTIVHMAEILKRDYPLMKEMIYRSCVIKKTVVEQDPTEKGKRALLNFGHTLGHAVEKLMNFKLHHGQCVGIGMAAAAYLSFKRGFLSASELDKICRTNTVYGLLNAFTGLLPEDILSATKLDKKMDQGKIKFILLRAIGDAYIDTTVSDTELLEAINYINGDRNEHE